MADSMLCELEETQTTLKTASWNYVDQWKQILEKYAIVEEFFFNVEQ